MAQKAINDTDAEPLILDSSAILAALLEEPGYAGVLDRISNAQSVGVGAPTFVETAIVLSSKLRNRASRPFSSVVLPSAFFRWKPEMKS